MKLTKVLIKEALREELKILKRIGLGILYILLFIAASSFIGDLLS